MSLIELKRFPRARRNLMAERKDLEFVVEFIFKIREL